MNPGFTLQPRYLIRYAGFRPEVLRPCLSESLPLSLYTFFLVLNIVMMVKKL